MPMAKVYRHGATIACDGNGKAEPPERTKCNGWTRSAIRRNRDFLYSVDERGLTGKGFALTLTVKVCPPTHEEWKALREAYMVRLRRLGMLRAHWLTEWQRRGVPHLHAAVWFPEEVTDRWVPGGFERYLVAHWAQLASEPYGARDGAQHVTPIYDVVGWNQYVSKHAARGLSHYQRNPENIPEGWREVGTGRMWGYLATKAEPWPKVEPARVDMPYPAFATYRRILCGYRLADARTAFLKARDALARAKTPDQAKSAGQALRAARRRIRQARCVRRGPTPQISATRPVSEWLPEAVQLRVLALLAQEGHDLSS